MRLCVCSGGASSTCNSLERGRDPQGIGGLRRGAGTPPIYIHAHIASCDAPFAVWIAREGRGGCDLRVTSYELRGTTDLGRVKSVAGQARRLAHRENPGAHIVVGEGNRAACMLGLANKVAYFIGHKVEIQLWQQSMPRMGSLGGREEKSLRACHGTPRTRTLATLCASEQHRSRDTDTISSLPAQE